MTQPNIAIVKSCLIIRDDSDSWADLTQVLSDNNLIEPGEHIEFTDADDPNYIVVSHRRVDRLAYNPQANLFDHIEATDDAYVIAEALLDCCIRGSYLDISIDNTVEHIVQDR